jgi:surface antigen
VKIALLAPFSWVPAGGFANRFPFGQCTWWAAYNRRVTWGGNAGDWLVNASAAGMPISVEPSLGAIVVYWPGGLYSPLGHVAVVTAVSPATYTVSEMNAAAGWGRVSTRTIRWPDADVQGFIPRID